MKIFSQPRFDVQLPAIRKTCAKTRSEIAVTGKTADFGACGDLATVAVLHPPLALRVRGFARKRARSLNHHCRMRQGTIPTKSVQHTPETLRVRSFARKRARIFNHHCRCAKARCPPAPCSIHPKRYVYGASRATALASQNIVQPTLRITNRAPYPFLSAVNILTGTIFFSVEYTFVEKGAALWITNRTTLSIP